jgi:hypothetical protein
MDLGGDTSPWEERARPGRQRPGSDNGFVGGARPWSRLPPEPDPDPTSLATGASRNESSAVDGGDGRRATAAAMRCGCRRGEPFEGCGPRRGKAAVAPRCRLLGDEPRNQRAETRRTPGPEAGRNKPAGLPRRKPSRWCETTRAERDVGAWNPRPDGTSDRSGGRAGREWTRRERRRRGGSGQGHERRNRSGFVPAATRFQRSRERSEDEAKVTRVDRPTLRCGRAAVAERPPGIRIGDGPRSRGVRGSPPTRSRGERRSPRRRIRAGASDAPEGPAHVTRAA